MQPFLHKLLPFLQTVLQQNSTMAETRRSNITGMQMIKAERGKQGKERLTLRRLRVLKDCLKQNISCRTQIFVWHWARQWAFCGLVKESLWSRRADGGCHNCRCCCWGRGWGRKHFCWDWKRFPRFTHSVGSGVACSNNPPLAAGETERHTDHDLSCQRKSYYK